MIGLTEQYIHLRLLHVHVTHGTVLYSPNTTVHRTAALGRSIIHLTAALGRSKIHQTTTLGMEKYDYTNCSIRQEKNTPDRSIR